MSENNKNIPEVEIDDETLDAVTGGGMGGRPPRDAIPTEPFKRMAAASIPQRTTFPSFSRLDATMSSSGSQDPES